MDRGIMAQVVEGVVQYVLELQNGNSIWLIETEFDELSHAINCLERSSSSNEYLVIGKSLWTTPEAMGRAEELHLEDLDDDEDDDFIEFDYMDYNNGFYYI
jgi:hypothetical protein